MSRQPKVGPGGCRAHVFGICDDARVTALAPLRDRAEEQRKLFERLRGHAVELWRSSILFEETLDINNVCELCHSLGPRRA